MAGEYVEPGPTRAEVDAARGPMVVEFGEDWCGHCRAAGPHVEAALAEFPDLPHIRVADGPGRPLGRSFRVKLWPTLVVLNDGREVGRVVRPASVEEVRAALRPLTTPGPNGEPE